MIAPIILDTGPLVAFMNQREKQHRWVKKQFSKATRLLTCDAVLSEACFLLRSIPDGPQKVIHFASSGIFELVFRLGDECSQVASLMEKYADTPMSLADACLVRIAEQYDRSTVLTFDSDFYIYRKHGTIPIELLIP